MPQIDVNLPGHAYSIHIEAGLLARIGGLAAAIVPSRRVMLAVDANIEATHGEAVARSLQQSGFTIHRHALLADERHKTIEAVEQLCHAMLIAGCHRQSCVIAIGGGIVGDIAGFAAASFMRGVPLIHIPTTLLAMVDASIGGKTGVNLLLQDGTLAKNMIGAFWQPRAIFADPQTLLTLDDRHFRCGLAECVKHAMIERSAAGVVEVRQRGQRSEVRGQRSEVRGRRSEVGGQRSEVGDQGLEGNAAGRMAQASGHWPPQLLDFLAANTAAIKSRDLDVLAYLITRSATIKAAIVQADERETAGLRALLNLGHTFAHGFESISDLNLLHGEAVAIGLIAATRCAAATGRMETSEAQRIRDLLQAFDLPLRLPRSAALNQVVMAMHRDKKKWGDVLRLIVPRGIGSAEIVDDVPQAIVEYALHEVGVT